MLDIRQPIALRSDIKQRKKYKVSLVDVLSCHVVMEDLRDKVAFE